MHETHMQSYNGKHARAHKQQAITLSLSQSEHFTGTLLNTDCHNMIPPSVQEWAQSNSL